MGNEAREWMVLLHQGRGRASWHGGVTVATHITVSDGGVWYTVATVAHSAALGTCVFAACLFALDEIMGETLSFEEGGPMPPFWHTVGKWWHYFGEKL